VSKKRSSGLGSSSRFYTGSTETAGAKIHVFWDVTGVSIYESKWHKIPDGLRSWQARFSGNEVWIRISQYQEIL
jgi:hypothetical protein